MEAIVAGTKGFALALLAPIADRVGARPHVAAGPAHALLYGQGPGTIVVVEFLGEDTLSALQDLVLEGGGLRIVVAVPRAHAAAEGPLRALGADAVRWDGAPDAVVRAVDRQMALAAAPPFPREAARLAPAAAAAKPLPGAARAASPRTSAAPGAPALTPTKPLAAVARPAAPAAPANTPTKPPAAVARPAALPAPAHAPAKPVAAVAPAAARRAAPALFQEPSEAGGALEVHVEDASASRGATSTGADAPWPTAVPESIEAADALGRALLGDVPAAGTPLAVVADVLAGLSDLERAVFSGQPQPFDTEPVRRAAVMRVRVAVALASAPAPGGAVDHGAVSALLAEIDALLSDVNALAAGAPPAMQLSLEAMRNALVKEAIDFSEVVQHAAPAQAMVPAEPVAHGRSAQTRVISMTAATGPEARPARHRALAVGLALAVLAAGAFHGYRYWSAQQRIRQAPTLPGLTGAIAPERSASAPNAPRAVANVRGEAFDAGELDAFAKEEAKKGNVVKQIAPGAILIVPAEPGQPPAAR